MKNTNVCFVVDNHYGIPMISAISSIIDNYKSSLKLNFFIIDLGLNADKISYLKKQIAHKHNIEINFIESKTILVDKFDIKTHVSSAAYIKVYLPEILKEINEVIYLDCDLIVNCSIDKLMSFYNKNFEVHAVWNPFYDYDNEYLGIKDDVKTFNSGVMILNLKLMRLNKSSEKLVNFLEENHKKTRLHDQAAFNYVYKYKWKELDITWNYQVSFIQNYYKKLNFTQETYFASLKAPKIIHFTSNSKPWQFRNTHPLKKLYIKYAPKELILETKRDITFYSLLKRLKEKLRYSYFFYINKF